jgi:tetratricopeptide (TPR) repeat protein
VTSDKCTGCKTETHGDCRSCGDAEPSYWCPNCNRAVAEKRCPLCGLKAQKMRTGTMGKVALAALLLAGLLAPRLLLAESYFWADREGFHRVDSLDKVPRDRRGALPMARNRTALPFSDQEDRDGAMYVWFILGQAGIGYPYTAADDLPRSGLFARVATPREGDIAWWPGHVALFRERERTLLSARGEEQLATVEERRGKAVWYRYDGPPRGTNVQPDRRAPQKALAGADRGLAGLDDASTFPPRATGDTALERLRGRWRQVEKSLERLRRQYPDDPRVLRRLGECFRLGHNLGVSGAAERAEAYLLRAEVLGPDDAETFIALGALYADSSMENGPLAETRFRRALKLAGKERLPQVWWGLAVSLYYQGRRAEALEAIDRVIALQPRDRSARKLRETILESGKMKDEG